MIHGELVGPNGLLAKVTKALSYLCLPPRGFPKFFGFIPFKFDMPLNGIRVTEIVETFLGHAICVGGL